MDNILMIFIQINIKIEVNLFDNCQNGEIVNYVTRQPKEFVRNIVDKLKKCIFLNNITIVKLGN